MSEKIDTLALRNKILNLAFSGKLVKQDPNDEPASILLEKIKQEKEKLNEEGKIKKDNKESYIYKDDDNHYHEKIGKQNRDVTEEIDFFLPDDWAVTRLANICEMSTGNSINEDIKEKKYKNILDGLNYIGTKDVGFDRTINYENGVKIPIEDNFRIAHKGSTLLCIEGGSAGKKLAITEEDVCYGNKLCSFETKGINNRFIFYYLQSPIFSNHFLNNINGIIGGVSINNLKRILIGIPPLAEQNRIVMKIEELFAEIDKIEKAQNELDNLKEIARTKVLDLAVRGKLVKQDPNDEPASVLLEKIKQEKEKLIKEGKIKGDKNESIIYKGDDRKYYEKIGNKVTDISEEISFEIPDNWCWTRQCAICWLDNGIITKGQSLPYLEAKTIRGIQEAKILTAGVTVRKGQKVILVDGENSGEVMDVPYDGYMGSTFRVLERSSFVDYEYLSYFFLLNKTRYRDNKQGSAIPHLNKNIFRNMLFPVPPLNEQQRIANKISQYFAEIN